MIVDNKSKHARLIIIGEWLYDNIKPMTIQIFAINYDFYFELNEGYHDMGEVENLNSNCEQYVILTNCFGFFKADSFPTFWGLTLIEAKEVAEKITGQKIDWQTPLSKDYL